MSLLFWDSLKSYQHGIVVGSNEVAEVFERDVFGINSGIFSWDRFGIFMERSE